MILKVTLPFSPSSASLVITEVTEVPTAEFSNREADLLDTANSGLWSLISVTSIVSVAYQRKN